MYYLLRKLKWKKNEIQFSNEIHWPCFKSNVNILMVGSKYGSPRGENVLWAVQQAQGLWLRYLWDPPRRARQGHILQSSLLPTGHSGPLEAGHSCQWGTSLLRGCPWTWLRRFQRCTEIWGSAHHAHLPPHFSHRCQSCWHLLLCASALAPLVRVC